MFFTCLENNLKIMQAESDTDVTLQCLIEDNYLSNYIEWRKDKIQINTKKNTNFILNQSKG